MWFRTCQECGHVQSATRPKEGELTASYAHSKCRKCKSEALDYGSGVDPRAEPEDYTSG
jgi:hypothetical protein